MRPDDRLETFSELAVKRQRRHTMLEIRCAYALLVYKWASSLTEGPCANAVQIARSTCLAAPLNFCPAPRGGTFRRILSAEP
jgi:hypothetical protein